MDETDLMIKSIELFMGGVESVLSRFSALSELFISLSAGAIVLIAAFIQKPPRTRWARWVLLVASFCFLIAFVHFLLTLQAIVTAQRTFDAIKLDMYVVALKGRIMDDVQHMKELSALATRVEKETEATKKRLSTYKNEFLAGVVFFMLGLVLMSAFTTITVMGWARATPPEQDAD